MVNMVRTAAALRRAAVPPPLQPALRAMRIRNWSSRASGSSRSLLVHHVAGAGLPSGHGRRLLCTSSFAEQLQVDQDEVFASRLDNDRGAMDIVNGLNDAVQLLQEQEDQGVAADRTQDLFMTAVMHDSKLYDAVLAYFTSQKDANPNTETYTSLIYVCVKLRQLDEGFKHFERMMNEGVLPDNRTYAHLIKGCGRTKQIKRGEAFWRLLKQRNAPQVYDRRVFNAMINMYSHSKQRHQYLTPAEAAPPWEIFGEMQNRGVEPDDVTYNSLISLCSRTLKPDVTRALSMLREMSAVGVPPSDVTLCALTQSLGRANNIELARSQIKELLANQPHLRPTTSTWRPLLHATAVSGDVEMTQTLFEEMKAACGSVLIDP